MKRTLRRLLPYLLFLLLLCTPARAAGLPEKPVDALPVRS